MLGRWWLTLVGHFQVYECIRGSRYAMWNKSGALLHLCFKTVSAKEVHNRGSLEHILLTSYVKQHREEVVSKDKA